MLESGRRQNEEILIGGRVRIRVQSVRGDTVSLIIDAPIEVSVLRSEIAERTSPVETKVCELPGGVGNTFFKSAS